MMHILVHIEYIVQYLTFLYFARVGSCKAQLTLLGHAEPVS